MGELNYKLFFLLIFVLFLGQIAKGQISAGGYPLELPALKSASTSDKMIRMSSFDVMPEMKSFESNLLLKSIKYAHSFDVELNTENSGEWNTVGDYRVWNLMLTSEDALSLNIIFSSYYLPEGGRLFLYDPQKQFIIGAFTARNNKPFRKLATYPIPGDTIVVQYEEPLDADFSAELEIGNVNHDFIGVVPLKNRWGRRIAGDCNIDVNCENSSGLENEQRAVCRILAKDELGSATLINQLSADGNPYVISAFHVFDDNETAEITLFDFNYESPYCTAIDGYDNQSISGSTAIASFDSLDFMLVELSEMPPAEYRPYLAGWNATSSLPSDCYIIHHPNGDVKKISHDEGECSVFTFSQGYIDDGHWKVGNWESGTTEGGSSGGALFNNEKQVVGTLTGGYASCTSLSYDAFARLDKMWDYRTETSKQLKHWLDPYNNEDLIVNGSDPYLDENLNCSVISNFLMEDEFTVFDSSISVDDISEVVECFDQTDVAMLSGVAIGIDGYVGNSVNPEVVIRIYSGDTTPDFAIQQYEYPMSDLTREAMNYFDFGETLKLVGTFFIGIVLYDNGDTLSVYRSDNRTVSETDSNSILVKDDGEWKSLSVLTGTTMEASLLMQATVCEVSLVQDVDTLDDNGDILMKYYPNPASNYVFVQFLGDDDVNQIMISDLVGRELFRQSYDNEQYAEIVLSNYISGIYVLRVSNGNRKETKRLLIIN